MHRLNSKIRRWCRSLDRKYVRPGYEPSPPDRVNIETASICNLHCSCCPHGASPCTMRPQGIMSPDTFRRVLAHLDIPLKLAYLHLHGEPFLNPHLPDYVGELAGRQTTVNLYSNSTAVDETMLDAVLKAKRVAMNFSADLLGSDHYEKLRTGARYADTMDKLDRLNSIFARHRMFFNITILTDRALAGKADAIYQCCHSLYSRYSQLNGILLGSRFPWPRLPWTGDLDGRLAKGHHRCPHAFEGPSILWNGDATMCSFDYTGECIVGSLLDSNYSQLLNNRAARRFRTLHWRHRNSELPLCNDCLLDRYLPASATLHRSLYLKNDKNETTRIIQSFFNQ